MIIAFIFGIICIVLYFITKDPAPWVSVIFCGIIIFGLGLSAATMAPLVGYSELFHQVVPQVLTNGSTALNSTNLVYVNEVIVYTFGSWVGYACYGLAMGGFIIAVAGLLLQMKEARRIANAVQAERVMGGEIDFRRQEPRGRT